MCIKDEVQKILESRGNSLFLRVRCKVDAQGIETGHEYAVVEQGEAWSAVDARGAFNVAVKNVSSDDRELNRVWSLGQDTIQIVYSTAFYTNWVCVTCEESKHDAYRERLYFDPREDIKSIERFESEKRAREAAEA